MKSQKKLKMILPILKKKSNYIKISWAASTSNNNEGLRRYLYFKIIEHGLLLLGHLDQKMTELRKIG